MRPIALIALACVAAGCAVDGALAPSLPETTAPVVRVEVDMVGDVELEPEAIAVAERAFLDAGLDARFAVSRDAADVPSRLVDRGDKSRLLAETRTLSDHVHVVVAPRGAGAHGVTHYERGPSASVAAAGVFVFVDSIDDDFRANELLAASGLEASQLVGRTLAHELGHALGCPHGGLADDGTVMVQNSTLGPVSDRTIERWRRALEGEGLGFPSFAPADRACLDPTAMLSVDRATPAYAD